MLADSAAEHACADGRVLVQITGDIADTGRRCTLIRASSELGVHRRTEDGVTGGAQDADGEVDRPTPLQVIFSAYPHLKKVSC